MHAVVESKRNEIVALCKRLGVLRLDVFGSATGDAFDMTRSDVDFVYELGREPGSGYFDAYFSLKEGLEALLGRPVDLLARSSIENPYLKAEVERTQERVYVS